jgi:hypothetical protein
MALVAPVNVQPDTEALIVGSFSVGMQVRAMGPDTPEWVAVQSNVPMVSGWVRRADSVELRR